MESSLEKFVRLLGNLLEPSYTVGCESAPFLATILNFKDSNIFSHC